MTDPGFGPAPEVTAAEVRRRLASELALPSRLGYTALLLAGLTAAAVAIALLLTEEGLPARTRIAFAVMTLIGLAWATFAAWVLTHRRVLFALHRVIAMRMAVAFTAVFTGGALLVGLRSSSATAALSAAAFGAAMLSVALVLHARARRRVQELMLRRQELERRLAEADMAGER
jgi:hypothetical protein